jgi:hypothetical protein
VCGIITLFGKEVPSTHIVTTKKKALRLFGPFFVIMLGGLFVVTEEGGYGMIVAKGPVAVFVGSLLCMSGAWAAIRTYQENRKDEAPNQTSEPTATVSGFDDPKI